MTSPLFTVSGLSSGLDTSSMIEQLMQLERNPVVLMDQQRARQQSKVDAWSSVTSSISSLRSAVNRLRDADDFDDFVSARSSDEDAVGAEVTTGGNIGSMSFTVDRLAAAHQLAASSSFTSSADQVGSGTLTIAVAGEAHEFDTDGDTLENLVAQINEADIGVTANALQVDDTTVRLVLSAEDTGSAAAFTASGTQASLASFDTVTQGEDAQLTVGSGPGAITIERSSNTVTDLIPGVELSLNSTTTDPVRIEAERDIDATVDEVKGLVNALNSVMSTIRNTSRWDEEGDDDGPLIGNSTLRRIESDLITEVTSVIDSLTGDHSYASTIGLEYSTDREFTLDEATLRSALEDDYEGVVGFFARNGAADDTRLTFGFAGDDTVPGAYGVTVTRAATLASTTGALYVPPGGDTTFTVENGSTSIEITVDSGSDLDGAVTRINTRLDEAGLSHLRATASSGVIGITSLRWGSGGEFTVTGSGSLGLDGTATATDVAGTIDGIAAEGTGRTLRSTSGASEGLGVTIGLTQSEIDGAGGSIALGDLSYSRGLMGELSELLSRWEGADGTLSRASAEHEDRIDTIDDQIERFEQRLEIREATLRRQFTAMETLLSDLQGQSSYLASAMAGLGTS